jgi:hypothetical protein
MKSVLDVHCAIPSFVHCSVRKILFYRERERGGGLGQMPSHKTRLIVLPP